MFERGGRLVNVYRCVRDITGIISERLRHIPCVPQTWRLTCHVCPYRTFYLMTPAPKVLVSKQTIQKS